VTFCSAYQYEFSGFVSWMDGETLGALSSRINHHFSRSARTPVLFLYSFSIEQDGGV